MRRTRSLLVVLDALLADPNESHWGYQLRRVTGLRSGVLYPILRRLLEAGWVEDGWEEPAAAEGRPPRRYYSLTPTGFAKAKAMVASVPAARQLPARPMPEGRA